MADAADPKQSGEKHRTFGWNLESGVSRKLVSPGLEAVHSLNVGEKATKKMQFPARETPVQ